MMNRGTTSRNVTVAGFLTVLGLAALIPQPLARSAEQAPIPSAGGGHGGSGQGRLRKWWTDYSRKHFKEHTDALVDQYSAFSPIEGLRVNGKQTLGENIGDLTGVSIAYRAYQLFLRDQHHGKAPVLDGYSGDQRFFLSWGQTWHYIATNGAIRYILTNGYHPPAKYRVNGVVRNIDAWYDAFGVTADQELYLSPKARVKLW